jgi:hypothetical protein
VAATQTTGIVREMMFGRFHHQIVYSNLTTCTTLTCVMRSGRFLLGAHFVMVAEDPLDFQAVLNGLRALQGTDAVSEMHIVRVGQVWDEGQTFAPEDFYSANQPATFRNALNYNGPIQIYETTGAGNGDAVSVSVGRTGKVRITVNNNRVGPDIVDGGPVNVLTFGRKIKRFKQYLFND